MKHSGSVKSSPGGPKVPWCGAGMQGGSSELLSPERQRKVDAYFIAELKRLGSDFPYAEFCDVAKEKD